MIHVYVYEPCMSCMGSYKSQPRPSLTTLRLPAGWHLASTFNWSASGATKRYTKIMNICEIWRRSNFVSTSGMHLSKSTNTTTTAACNIFCKLRRTFGLVPWHKLTQPITRLQLSQFLFQCMIRPPHVCMSLHISVYICGTGQGLWKRRKICNMFKSKTSAKNVKNTNTQCSEMQCPQQLPICSMKGQIEMIEIRKHWWNSKDAKDDRLQGFKAANPAARWIERLVKPDAWIWLVNLGSLGFLPAEALDFLLWHGKTSSKHGFHETWTWLNTSEDNWT